MQERKYRNVFNRRKTEQMKIKIEIERWIKLSKK